MHCSSRKDKSEVVGSQMNVSWLMNSTVKNVIIVGSKKLICLYILTGLYNIWVKTESIIPQAAIGYEMIYSEQGITTGYNHLISI